MALRTIAWPNVTVDDAQQPVQVIQWRIYLDGTLAYNFPPPQQSQIHDFSPGSTTLIEVSAEGPGGEGPRASKSYTEPTGVPVAPGDDPANPGEITVT